MSVTKPQQQKRQSGFTIIELVVVIIVIGILLGFVLAARSGVAQDKRNTERQRDIGELRDELEAYYAQSQMYPTLSNVNDPTWRTINMKGLDKEVLRDPSSSSYTLADKPARDVYTYQVSTSGGNACDDKKKICAQYTLTATLEGGGIYVKNNLN